MVEITAIKDTFLKKEPLQSSDLKPQALVKIQKGRKFQADELESLNSHIKYRLAYGAGDWWVYAPHWQIYSDTESLNKQRFCKFPSGLPKPSLKLSPSKTEVIEAIVNYCLRVRITNRCHIAYILSTAENESQFKPVREYRGVRLTRDQQKYWHSGYMGRGFIQVTWKSNYVKVGKYLGLDLVENPDLLLTYPVAIASLVLGMRDGWYTGKKLKDYKPGDYWHQREIVNPGEIKYQRYWYRASKFVESAEKWESYLRRFTTLYPNVTV